MESTRDCKDMQLIELFSSIRVKEAYQIFGHGRGAPLPFGKPPHFAHNLIYPGNLE